MSSLLTRQIFEGKLWLVLRVLIKLKYKKLSSSEIPVINDLFKQKLNDI